MKAENKLIRDITKKACPDSPLMATFFKNQIHKAIKNYYKGIWTRDRLVAEFMNEKDLSNIDSLRILQYVL